MVLASVRLVWILISCAMRTEDYKEGVLHENERNFITFLPKYSLGPIQYKDGLSTITKMSVRLRFPASASDRIVTDIQLSSETSQPIQTRGLWDSGAMTCCIKKSLSDSLNLSVVGNVKDTVMVGRPATDRDVVQLDVQVSEEIKFRNLNAVVLPDVDMSTGFIIGMNLINRGVMKIDGRSLYGWLLFDFDLQ